MCLDSAGLLLEIFPHGVDLVYSSIGSLVFKSTFFVTKWEE